jgi:hypothetical protein
MGNSREVLEKDIAHQLTCKTVPSSKRNFLNVTETVDEMK